MLYPVLFKPIYKEMVWGGQRLGGLPGRQIPYASTGESWDISCRPGEMGIVENGPDAGMTFAELTVRDPVSYLGTEISRLTRFPLLIKLIDANDNLSVQVHPPDGFVRQQDPSASDSGKNEMWYVMEPPDDGHLLIGVRDGVTKDMLRVALTTGHESPPESLFNRLPVKKGDIVNIPAGLAHAITKGAMIAEIQQNSDITYRLYDYGRAGLDGKPRELHIDLGLAATDLSLRFDNAKIMGTPMQYGPHRITHVLSNGFFTVFQYDIIGEYAINSDVRSYSVYTCVDGECIVTTQPESISVHVDYGRSVFVPPGCKSITIGGVCKLLRSFHSSMGS